MGIKEVQHGIRRIQLDAPLVKKPSLFKLKCNIYAVKADAGITLFDCGPMETVTMLQSALQAERVTQIFLTHGHSDHAGSAVYWLKEGAKVFAPQDECTLLASGGPENAPQAFRYRGFEPTGILKVDDRIAIDKAFDFVVLRTPGHTSGSVCYYDERRDILISGDLMFGPVWGHMVTFLLEFITSLRQPDADLQRQIESLEKLLNSGVIKRNTLILPGHGATYHMQEKPNAVRRSSGLLRLCLRL